jgi:Carboxypeptidase regulatory-like domain/TonB-dependent Receptor Plug Domain
MNRFLYLALGLLLAAAPAFAQISTGNIYGTVTDEQGGVLPGVTVTLTGDFGTRGTTTSANGEFRFLALDNGTYKLTVALAGFGTAVRSVRVTTAENLNLPFALKVAGVQETIEVTGGVPLVDVKKRGTSTTMISDELQKVPNARDPWGILKNVPGVVVDRINIAGNNNGQQADAGGHGSMGTDKMWNLDGVTITDMSASGASPTYFDFDAFQEIAVTTGGADLSVGTGGLGINLVTKRGTNKFHGGGRFLYTSDATQSSNLPDALRTDPRLQNPDGTYRDKADHIDQIQDWGFDLGGPIIKDKLWFYGTWGRQQVDIIALNGIPDKTKLTSYNAKLNWQATRDTMVSGFWFDGAKEKQGRLTGVGSATGLNETADFLWNQGNLYEDNPFHGFWKLQVDQTFSPNFFMSAKVAYYNTGFTLAAAGSPDQSYTYDYAAGNAIGSYATIAQTRPQKSLNADGSYFFRGMGGNHELKFGFGYRAVTSNSQTHYNGNGIGGKYDPANDNVVATVHRDGLKKYEGRYLDFYVGDTYTKKRFSVNVGVRFDQQKAKNNAAQVPGNPGLPDLLPALSYPGNSDYIINWKDWSPRVGMSYAFDDQQKTVARISYARYAEQLSFGNVTEENPVAPGALAYFWNDINGDHYVQPNEVLLDEYQYNYGGVNPQNPSEASTPLKIDRNYQAAKSHEIVAGVDHQLMPNFAVGAAYVWRKNVDLSYYPRLSGPCSDPNNPTLATCPIITADLYTPVAPVTSGGHTVQGYAPPSALVDAGNSGRILTTQPGYSQNFNGVDVTLTKRLSNKWMGRVALTYNLLKQHYDSGVIPVNGVWGKNGQGSGDNLQGNPTPSDRNSLKDDLVGYQSTGSGPQTYYTSPRWQVYANALVQLPWDLELSGALFGRQGQVQPRFITVSLGRDGTQNVLASPTIDATRYDSVWDFDMRLAKNIKMGPATLTLSAEGFNLFNANTTLQVNRRLNTSTALRINEIMSPRIFRFGGRVSF